VKERLNRDQTAAIAAQELRPGWVVNLGVGMPAFVSNYIFPEMEITLHAEHGLLGYGPLADEVTEDPDTTNATGDYVTLLPGAVTMNHAESFSLIRRGIIDCVVLGAYEVDKSGSFSNWKIRTELPTGIGNILGGAMDLAQCSKRVFIMMEHTLSDGITPRIIEKCTLPITAENVVTQIITDIAVITVEKEGLVLKRHAPGFSAEDIQALTGVPLIVSPGFCSAL